MQILRVRGFKKNATMKIADAKEKNNATIKIAATEEKKEKECNYEKNRKFMNCPYDKRIIITHYLACLLLMLEKIFY